MKRYNFTLEFGKIDVVSAEREGTTVNFKKWLSVAATTVLLATTLHTTAVNAEEKPTAKSIADESIYDVLVDRFFNKTSTNDYDVNTKDPSKFVGGDFAGLTEKFEFIYDMGYSIVSIGPVFATEKYDGTLPTSFNELERHFGTEEELTELVETYHKYDMQVMADFPIGMVSANHEWAKDSKKKAWFTATNDGKAFIDTKNADAQKALIEAVTNFVKQYNLDGIRLTQLEDADADFLNTVIAAIKKQNKAAYVIADAESNADFDATFSEATNDVYRNIFKNVDQDSSRFEEPLEGFLSGKEKPEQLMVDNLNTARFTLDSANENAFPPTRVRMALGTLFMLPGTPIVQYGTEIAMNGDEKPNTHQAMNFKVDEEIINYIKNMQSLRNKSETLRHGDFKVVKNDNGLLVFTRQSDDESWIIFANNTGQTQRVTFTKDEIGENKEIRGLFEKDVIRAGDDGKYHVVLDREIVELFQVKDDQGLNIPYLLALALVYVVFIAFIVIIIRRGKKARRAQR